MSRDGIKTPKDTNFIVGILECGNRRYEKVSECVNEQKGDHERSPLNICGAVGKEESKQLCFYGPIKDIRL